MRSSNGLATALCCIAGSAGGGAVGFCSGPSERLTGWLRGPRTGLFAMLAIGYVLVAHGTPHILDTYRCSGVGTLGKCCYDCGYIGVGGVCPYMGRDWECPVFVMLPLKLNRARQVSVRWANQRLST